MNDLDEIAERLFWTKELTTALTKMLETMYDFQSGKYDTASQQFDIAARRLDKLAEKEIE